MKRCTVICISSILSLAQVTGCAEPDDQPIGTERSRLSLVREDAESARVEGIGPLAGFANGKDCTFIHCLEVVLEACGRKISYDTLMAVSGMAFRTQFRVDGWDVGNSDPLVGDNRLEDLFAAVGWEFEVRVVRRDEFTEERALHLAIRRSIDGGVPVLAANIIPPEDWGIITGYRRGRQYLCRSYNDNALRLDMPSKGWPTAVVILTKQLSPPVREKLRLDAVKRAIELFERRATGRYAQGARAFDEWCQSLRTATDRTYVHSNFWTYICLIDARSAAGRYLRSVASDFGGRSSFVSQAAEAYERETQLLLEGLANVPSEQTSGGSMPPPELRRAQIATLEAAKVLEAQAVEALKKAM